MLTVGSKAQVPPLDKCPKHYMLIFLGSAQSNMSTIFGNPDFVGIQKRYLWKDLEPTKDNYDFSDIWSDLNYLTPNGKHLIVAIHVNSHNGDPIAVPAYTQTAAYAGGIAQGNSAGEWIAKRWNTPLNGRLAALFTALADTFNLNLYFDGVTFDESAAPIQNCASPGDYTATGLRDGLMQNMKDARNAFAPGKVIIQYLNNFHCLTQSQQLPLFKSIDSLGAVIDVGVGGPDVVVGNYTTSQPLQKSYDGLMPLGTALQSADYGYVNPYTGKTVKAEEILRWAVDSLALDYIFWLKKSGDFVNDVVPTLANYRSQCLVSTSADNTLLSENTIFVSPNPSGGVYTLIWNISDDKSETIVYNVLGEKVFQQFNSNDRSATIDLSAQPDGFYFMQLTTQKEVFSKKVIIKK